MTAANIEVNATSFEICGFSFPLVGVDLPNTTTVKHLLDETDKEKEISKKQWKGKNECDITLVIGEKTVHANKSLLSSRIPFFRDLFNSNMIECTNGVVNLSSKFCEFDLLTMESLLDYACTGVLVISNENVQELLLGASFLRIDSVIEECAEFIRRRLTIENIFQLFFTFRSIEYHGIDSYLQSFIDANFSTLSFTHDFINLSIDDLFTFLKRDSLNIEEESQVFNAVTRWIDFEVNRRQFATQLLECIRWNYLTMDFISKTVEKTEWVINNSDCRKIVGETKKKKRGTNSNCLSNRFCYDAHYLFLLFLPADDSPDDFCFQIYDPLTNFWTELKRFSIPHKIGFFRWEQNGRKSPQLSAHANRKRFGSALAVVDGKVYMVGGKNNEGDYVSSLEICDPVSYEWKSLTPMSNARAYHACVDIDGKIYVIGGKKDHSSHTNSGECYDPETDSWSPINSMMYKREMFEANVINKKIYVTGGYDGENTLDTVEKYDPSSDQWKTLKSMTTKRADHSSGVSCGKLFVFGGVILDEHLNFEEILSTVEMYDPVTDIWEQRKQMEQHALCYPIPIPSTYPTPTPNLENIWHSEFRRFNLKEELLRAIVEYGFMNPTIVQSECIPPAIEGKDVMCEYGSKGKTSSFVISTLHILEPIDLTISILILVPNREMASAAVEEYLRFSKYYKPLKICELVGSVPMKKNVKALQNECPQIIVGTPIRIVDLIHKGALKINKIQILVLDGCDRMIADSNMRKAVKNIFESTERQKQILGFGVTNCKTKQILQDYAKRSPLKCV